MNSKEKQRKRLIEILQRKPYGHSSYEDFADYLLENNVIALPVKIGELVYVIDTYDREILTRPFNIGMTDRIGIDVFLTEQEAENELAEGR